VTIFHVDVSGSELRKLYQHSLDTHQSLHSIIKQIVMEGVNKLKPKKVKVNKYPKKK
jgi:hypothetical protein